MSRIGRMPVVVPSGVDVAIDGSLVTSRTLIPRRPRLRATERLPCEPPTMSAPVFVSLLLLDNAADSAAPAANDDVTAPRSTSAELTVICDSRVPCA